MISRSYYRIYLGKKNAYAEQCFSEGFVGVSFGIERDLTEYLAKDLRAFTSELIPLFIGRHPEKTKVAAGLACGALYTLGKGISMGDLLFCPDGNGNYRVGEVVSDYYYEASDTLPHRRKVSWQNGFIEKGAMSQALQNSVGSIATVCHITKYASELEDLLKGNYDARIEIADQTIEDPVVFALERHLEDFLVRNWTSTILGREYDIYEEEGENIGQQYPSDTGPIDILAISKDKRELLVVELKKGRASDAVLGQIQRYMGYVLGELAEDGQTVKGLIIALEDDLRLRRALQVTSNISFYRYEVDFRLFPALSEK